ncbi:molybdopterin cofactor-binding domain-containing protein [Maritimibacter sp. 55A14]|uniref:molybdopterin cofactor-binding domain-containing protein n=1 Tax=Maritimibacter sp. 55A14 TaxID=2174844 RepID=UPI001304BACA|nr:molybdopterin cofactor-binding domain-containing protein [Maritimibacter sp. 55A14]
MHDWLGLPFDQIAVVDGDTDQVTYGDGTYASRSVTVGGSALRRACDGVIARGRGIAAKLIGVAESELEFERGLFVSRDSNASMSLSEVAVASYRVQGHPAELGVGLEAVGTYTAQPQNYPNGCHIAEVEVDPDFGTVSLMRYSAVDDVGRAVNPLLLEGQLAGATAMGLGQALLEQVVHDDLGQQITAAFTEYGVPRAGHMAEIQWCATWARSAVRWPTTTRRPITLERCFVSAQ